MYRIIERTSDTPQAGRWELRLLTTRGAAAVLGINAFVWARSDDTEALHRLGASLQDAKVAIDDSTIIVVRDCYVCVAGWRD